MLDEVAPRLTLLATAEEDSVRHDGRHLPVGLQHGEHVLHEHQVGFLALLRHPHREAARILDLLLDVVLAERRIGEDAVVALQLVALVLVLRPADGVFLANVSVRDAVQQHVHLADRPCRADALLTEKRQVARIATALAHMVARLDEHTARAAGRVVHAHVRLRVDDLDQRAHDFARRVELAGLLSGGVGEPFDQRLICGTQ